MTGSRPTVSFSSSFEKYQYSQSAPPLHAPAAPSSSHRHPFPSTSQRQSSTHQPISKRKQDLSMVLYQEVILERNSRVTRDINVTWIL